jgi:cell division transport system permease protein
MKNSDIPFATDDAHAFMPWVIGVMACLATLLLCLGLTVGSWIIDRHQAYASNFTVNIPSTGEDAAPQIAKIQTILRPVAGVTRVEQVSDTHLRAMLKPWLGNGDTAALLPLPVVLDVAIANNAAIDYKDLQVKISAVAPGAEIDAHEVWIANFRSFSFAIQWVLTALAGLIVGALALMIAFTSRASLKLHAKTVQLLHSIGAEDGYIMRQFQREASRLTFYGTVPGCLAAGLAYALCGFYVARLESSILPSIAMTRLHVALLLLMPLVCGAVAWVAARLSVLKQLQKAL